jgi:hypothetical protein
MMAFEIPPPNSPTGLGRWVKKLQLTTEMPLLVMKNRMKNTGRIEHKVRRMMITLNNLSHKILLLIEEPSILYSCTHPADDQLTQDVYNGGNDEENKSQFNQTRQIETPCRFCEFVGNDTGQGVARTKNTLRYKI